MADARDVEIVRGGADSIREYRKSHEGWDRPFDLRGADLSGLLLAGADLGGADLSEVKLVGASLTDCNLSQANLTDAILTEATLTRCRMREASFRAADATASRFQSCDFRRANAETSTFEKTSLVGASLIGGNWTAVNASAADFLRADLSFSRWRGSNLHGAAMSSTILAATDLSGALGLESVVFDGPCPIDDSTIRTIDPLVRPFLRGCGLPDDLIAFYVSSAGTARFHTVFISYSTAQQEFADQIYTSLQSEGLRVWLATEDLKTGDRFRQVIYDAIRLHDKLLLVLSQESVASEWVEDEVNAALAREREEGRSILFPVTLDDALWKTDRAWVRALSYKRHVCDFTQWRDASSYSIALKRLLRDLRM